MNEHYQEDVPRRRGKSRRRVGVPLVIAAISLTAFGAALASSDVMRNSGERLSAPANRSVPLSGTATPRSTDGAPETSRGQGAKQGGGHEERAKAFTSCMRSHGLRDFPGITISDGGRIQLKGSVDPFDKTYRTAAKACSHLLPEGSSLPNTPRPPSPPTEPRNLQCTADCPTPPAEPKLPF